MWKIKQPYNVNVAATLAAEASLADLDYLHANVNRLKEERKRLLTALRSIPYLQPHPSQANFILCKVVDKVVDQDASQLKTTLAHQHGILVRHFDTPLLHNYIRISVGRTLDTNMLLAALDSIATH